MKTLLKMPRKGLIIIIGVVVLAAVACTGAAPTATLAPTPQPTSTAVVTETATEIPAETQIAVAVTGSGIIGGDPEFNPAALVWQGYWLSRDQFGPLVMASGMGIPFEPPMEMMAQAMQMVAQNADDPLTAPLNMLPLQAMFASGSPDMINDPRDFDPLDMEGLRLDPSTFDETVRVRARAETMLKMSQWAHNFANEKFGEPTDDFGALQRFIGVMVNMLAQVQGQYATENLLNMDDGLYRDSDGALDYTGNWVMLHTLSDISLLTGESGGRYANPDMPPMFENAANGLFMALEAREPESAKESAAAIRALTYRAWTAEDPAVAQDALAKASTIANATLVDHDYQDLADQAAALAGLLSIASAQDSGEFRHAADAVFESMAADFDASNGVFISKDVYNVDEVAWIIGGLNSLVQQGSRDNKGAASDMLLAFYEATISLGGMQLSAPPGKNGVMAGEFEKDLPSVIFYHPANVPSPPMVGKLPVPAEEITWDGEDWQVTSDRLVTAGAMHLANELNWLGPHLGSIPFPPQTP